MPGMQFPYPRKSSVPSSPHVYAAARSTPLRYRRIRSLKTYAPPVLVVVALLWLLARLFGRTATSAPYIPPGTPEVVIVTPLDPKLSERQRDNIRDNRRAYAQRHGYRTFFPNTTDYDLMDGTPPSWSTVPALRHAMTLHPHTPWMWFLGSSALIMNPRESLRDKILEPRRLEKSMIPDQPVVPPDSVIKTFAHTKGERVDLILSQDAQGLAGDSILLRTGEWAQFFLDAWFDPLYRSYNFQKAEGHALEHMVQWHGTVLAKLALVPSRIINSYTPEAGDAASADGNKPTPARPPHSRWKHNPQKNLLTRFFFLQACTRRATSWPTSTVASATPTAIARPR
jgi:hypothetical protein